MKHLKEVLKNTYDPSSHFFKYKKCCHPEWYDLGFIPGTKGADGEPLDVLVVSELHSFPGCFIYCKNMGGFEAEQSMEIAKIK